MSNFTIILGSSSMSRKEVLVERLGFKIHSQVSPDIDEEALSADLCRENIEEVVLRVGKAKADAVLEKIKDFNWEGVENPILVCGDLLVVVNEKILGKPRNREICIKTLENYNENNNPETYASLVVVNLKDRKKVVFDTCYTKTSFNGKLDLAMFNDDDLARLQNCAGSFLVEHPAFKKIIKSQKGSIEGTMGICGDLLSRLVKEVL
eukprot:GHVP01049974.1.p1 GENE.GHVP01049974.1~~GHVP01049974.1.p1  ORF type:complete len:207 (+),score=46.01 GHVP01049974.1:58-678(+)